MRRPLTLALAIVALTFTIERVEAQTGAEPSSSQRGIDYLKSHIDTMDPTQAAMAALALHKNGVPAYDPAIIECLSKLGPCFTGGAFKPITNQAQGLIEASAVTLALANIGPTDYRAQIEAAAGYIMGKQYATGGWDYVERTQGDESITQYCLLALWEAENVGVLVAPQVWDKAARFYLTTQATGGSWTLHRESPLQGETIAMTAAGISSLMLCDEQLARYRTGDDLVNPLMLPVTSDGQPAESRYKAETKAVELRQGIARGLAWLTAKFQVSTSPIMGTSPYEALYAVERVTALGGAPKVQVLGTLRWYEKGMDLILNSQKPTGSWEATGDTVLNTCWAMLFSARSTSQSRDRIAIRKLPSRDAATSPINPAKAEVVDGRIVARPMVGTVDALLEAIEDPAGEDADAALAGLVAKTFAEGPKAIRPVKGRFRKLLHSRDGAMRADAAWFLARTGDLDVAPDLIKALLDANDDVVTEARTGLLVLSRKVDGFGPASKATPEQKKEAAQKWRDWFESIRPPDLDAPVDLPAAR